MEDWRETSKYDRREPRQAQRHGREKGIRITIPAAELRAAGIDPNGPPPKYLTVGRQRSANGHTVFVSLYPPKPDIADLAS